MPRWHCYDLRARGVLTVRFVLLRVVTLTKYDQWEPTSPCISITRNQHVINVTQHKYGVPEVTNYGIWGRIHLNFV
jgi:hypothetical protein